MLRSAGRTFVWCMGLCLVALPIVLVVRHEVDCRRGRNADNAILAKEQAVREAAIRQLPREVRERVEGGAR